MRRHDALRDLSSEHHRALVLIRRIRASDPEQHPALAREVQTLFQQELAPHFAEEERGLLPLLELKGEATLVAQTLDEHRQLKALVEALNVEGNLTRFADLLETHVRFEERRLFQAAQQVLSEAELTQLATSDD